MRSPREILESASRWPQGDPLPITESEMGAVLQMLAMSTNRPLISGEDLDAMERSIRSGTAKVCGHRIEVL